MIVSTSMVLVAATVLGTEVPLEMVPFLFSADVLLFRVSSAFLPVETSDAIAPNDSSGFSARGGRGGGGGGGREDDDDVEVPLATASDTTDADVASGWSSPTTVGNVLPSPTTVGNGSSPTTATAVGGVPPDVEDPVELHKKQ